MCSHTRDRGEHTVSDIRRQDQGRMPEIWAESGNSDLPSTISGQSAQISGKTDDLTPSRGPRTLFKTAFLIKKTTNDCDGRKAIGAAHISTYTCSYQVWFGCRRRGFEAWNWGDSSQLCWMNRRLVIEDAPYIADNHAHLVLCV